MVSYIQTVRGPLPSNELGLTLVHEHIMVDFAGAEETGPHRWNRDDVVKAMLPYLRQAQALGVTGFVDCTPNYLGRDVLVLKRLSQATDLHILTNTGLYKEPHLPASVLSQDAEELAEAWIGEWDHGIDGTDVKPGVVKIAVNEGHLLPVQARIVRGAALTHLATGMTVVCHTNDPIAAHEALDIVEEEGMDPARYVVAHAHNITDTTEQIRLADRGCWMSYDAFGSRPLDEMARLVLEMLEAGREHQVLLSHDAGWYRVGEPEGGPTRPYTALFETFVPAMRQQGVPQDVIDRLLVENPRRALAIA